MRDLLVYSNLSYLIPIIVLVYKYIWQKSIHITGFIILSFFYLAVLLYSINYHICQYKLKDRIKFIQKHFFANVALCSKNGILYTQAEFNDLIIANFAVFITFIYIIPINNDLRNILQSIGILWVITLQSFSNIFNNSIYIAIPTILVALFYILYLVFSFKHFNIISRIFSIFGCIISIIGIILFYVKGNYNLYHSLWHILGGVSGGCLLFPAIISEDKFTWKGLFKFYSKKTLTDTKL